MKRSFFRLPTGALRVPLRALLFFLGVLLVLSGLLACSPADPDAPDTTPTDEPTPTGDAPNVDLALYTIIRSEDAGSTVKSSAVALRNAVQCACGLELPIVTDYVSAKENHRTEYEIVVGHTNIPEENEIFDALGEDEYAIRLTGNKLVIVGKTDAITEKAVDIFMKKYLQYDKNVYQNPTGLSEKLSVANETAKAPSDILSGGRRVTEIEEPSSDPIELNTKTVTLNGCSIEEDGIRMKNATCTFSAKPAVAEGPYRLQASVKISGTVQPTLQFFFNNEGKSVNLSVSGNAVTVVRYDYERGGNSFTGDSKEFTLRADVYPESGFFRYYINGIFLGEIDVASNDYPLLNKASLTVAAIGGEGMDVLVYDIYLENIPDENRRTYSVPDVEVGDEEVYPKSENAPADEIYVVDTAGLSDDELLTLVTLQGIVNRTTPRIFVDYRKYNNDPHYVDIANEDVYYTILESKGRTLKQTKLKDLLVTFRDEYAGVILGTPFSGGTDYEENVITTLSGVLDGVYMSNSLFKSVKDKIQKDILINTAGRFTGAVDAYMWVWKTYGSRCSKTILFHMPTGSDSVGHPALICRDYAVMSRAFVFCTDGIETLEDYDFYMNLFASTAPNTAVLGQSGGCFSEFEMFLQCGRYGKYFTYAFSTPNLSLLNSLETGELRQSASTGVTLEKNTVYVTFDLSEGDNLSWDYHLWLKNYDETEKRAAVAKGYSICGAFYYLAPALLEYYYNNATPNDCFFMDGGGISNLSCPDDFGYVYGEEWHAVRERMLELTEYVADKADLHVVRAIQNISDEMAALYSEYCPSVEGLFSSYAATTYQIGGYGGDYTKSVYSVDGTVRARLTLAETWNVKDVEDQLKTFVKKTPSEDGIYFARYFIYGNLILDNLDYFAELEAKLKTTGYNVVVVRPDDFVRLYKEYDAKY